MSSISVGELKTILENIPDDYEVIMSLKQLHKDIKTDSYETVNSIAYISGIDRNDDFREIKLLN